MKQDEPLNVLAVVGSMNVNSVTRIVVHEAARQLIAAGAHVDFCDLAADPLVLFNPDSAYTAPYYDALKARVENADVFLLGTPDYHGSMSSAIKNFLDHFWREFAGKLFGSIVASHEKGLTVADQLRTVARQCYAWSLPYGISFADGSDVKGGVIVSDALNQRLAMFVRDLHVYGRMLASQRALDLAGTEHCFLERHRSPL